MLRARRLADGLGRVPGIVVRTPRPETNMVFFKINDRWVVERRVSRTDADGWRAYGTGARYDPCRHALEHVTTEDIDLALRAAADIMRSGRRAAPRGSLDQVGLRSATEQCAEPASRMRRHRSRTPDR